MKKLTLVALFLLTSLYTFADGFIIFNKTQLQIFGGGEDYDDELDIAILDGNGELLKFDITKHKDNSITIQYYGNTDGEFVIVRVFDKKTNKTTYYKYKKAQ